jgi:hypothetical protein
MDRTDHDDVTELRDMLFAVGGAALVVLGAGLIISHPLVRRYVGQMGLNNMVQGALPDFERYMKLRQM